MNRNNPVHTPARPNTGAARSRNMHEKKPTTTYTIKYGT
uniref:Protein DETOXIFICATION 44ic n=1 Tax=Rhizophora mucronata TaxID=61149 RepID=A0A2P2M5Y7_RHIMU